MFKGRALKQFNTRRNIKWRYNLSQAPWWGGLFERLIYKDEVEKVLTPSHLYCERRLLDEQNNESSDEDIAEINTAENSAKRRRHMNKIIERFWRKW